MAPCLAESVHLAGAKTATPNTIERFRPQKAKHVRYEREHSELPAAWNETDHIIPQVANPQKQADRSLVSSSHIQKEGKGKLDNV